MSVHQPTLHILSPCSSTGDPEAVRALAILSLDHHHAHQTSTCPTSHGQLTQQPCLPGPVSSQISASLLFQITVSA